MMQTRNKINYEAYKFRCEVDFVKVLVSLDNPSNGGAVRALTNTTYAQALDEGPGGSATQFRIDFNDPKSWSHISEQLNLLENRNGFLSYPKLGSIEIAFDAYSIDQNRINLIDMAEHFVRFGMSHCSENLRINYGRVRTENGWHCSNVNRSIADGATFYVGDKKSPIHQKIYVKQRDKNNKLILPIEQHRARYEITLSDDAVPFSDLKEARTFSLQSLSKWFFSRSPNDNELAKFSSLNRLVLEHRPVKGSRASSGRNIYDRTTSSDVRLNTHSYEAMRNLDRRMKTEPRSVKCRKPGGLFCLSR